MLFLKLEQRLELSEKVRVVFKLIHDWLVCAVLQNHLEVCRREIRNADRLEYAFVFKFFEDLPCSLDVFGFALADFAMTFRGFSEIMHEKMALTSWNIWTVNEKAAYSMT